MCGRGGSMTGGVIELDFAQSKEMVSCASIREQPTFIGMMKARASCYLGGSMKDAPIWWTWFGYVQMSFLDMGAMLECDGSWRAGSQRRRRRPRRARRHGWCSTAEAKELTGGSRRRSERVRGVASAHQEPLRQARGRQWRQPRHGCSGTAEVGVALLALRVRLRRRLRRRAHILTHTMWLYILRPAGMTRVQDSSAHAMLACVCTCSSWWFACRLGLTEDIYF
jgi:hypothetical protein